MVNFRKIAHCLVATFALLALPYGAVAESVRVPGLNIPLCGIRFKDDIGSQLALKQYLSHFSHADLSETSLEPQLDSNGRPCIRPVLQNTSVSLIQRVVELGYADWDPLAGMLDLDTWIMSSTHVSQGATRRMGVSRGAKAKAPGAKEFPGKFVLIAISLSSTAGLIVTLGRLSPLLTPRSSVAAINGGGYRTKIRGIAIPVSEALSVTNTDIRAIAYKRTTRKYRHNGWQLVEDVSDQVRCSVDDGTGSVDIDITQANVHCSNTVTIYNDIPGEPVNRTPYVDDTFVQVRYIPVGAIVTIIGMLDETETGYRASRFVQVYAGDERSEVRRLKILVFSSVCMLLFSSVMFFVLRQSR